MTERHLNQLAFTTPCYQHLISSLSCSINVYIKVLKDHPDIVKSQFHLAVPKHGIMHHINTTGPPLHARACRLPPDNLLQPKEEFRKWRKWVSCIFQTAHGHPCCILSENRLGAGDPVRDYHRLNDITTVDQYPVPHTKDFMANLDGAEIFFEDRLGTMLSPDSSSS